MCGLTRPLAVTMRTTAATMTTLATIVRGVSGSWSRNAPSSTATTGLT